MMSSLGIPVQSVIELPALGGRPSLSIQLSVPRVASLWLSSFMVYELSNPYSRRVKFIVNRYDFGASRLINKTSHIGTALVTDTQINNLGYPPSAARLQHDAPKR